MVRYDLGCGCVKIARDLDLTFDSVFDVLKAEYPDMTVRLGTITSI